MANGDWIDRASKAILQLGVPTVFAVVLLWFVLYRLGASVDRMVAEMQEQTRTLVEIQQRVIHRDKHVFDYDWPPERRKKEPHAD